MTPSTSHKEIPDATTCVSVKTSPAPGRQNCEHGTQAQPMGVLASGAWGGPVQEHAEQGKQGHAGSSAPTGTHALAWGTVRATHSCFLPQHQHCRLRGWACAQPRGAHTGAVHPETGRAEPVGTLACCHRAHVGPRAGGGWDVLSRMATTDMHMDTRIRTPHPRGTRESPWCTPAAGRQPVCRVSPARLDVDMAAARRPGHTRPPQAGSWYDITPHEGLCAAPGMEAGGTRDGDPGRASLASSGGAPTRSHAGFEGQAAGTVSRRAVHSWAPTLATRPMSSIVALSCGNWAKVRSILEMTASTCSVSVGRPRGK